jgi:hypothetical protein
MVYVGVSHGNLSCAPWGIAGSLLSITERYDLHEATWIRSTTLADWLLPATTGLLTAWPWSTSLLLVCHPPREYTSHLKMALAHSSCLSLEPVSSNRPLRTPAFRIHLFSQTGSCTLLRSSWFLLARPRNQAGESSEPIGTGQHPFLLPCGPYVIVIPTACSFCLATCSRWFLAWLIFDPDDGGNTFLWNVGSYTDYTALYPGRWEFS